MSISRLLEVVLLACIVHCALRLREKFPKAKILVLEKGVLPQGASTKNAGFACFGSISEILDDLNEHTEQEVFNLIEKRWKGLLLLRNRLGDSVLDLKSFGGYELFLEKDEATYQDCLERIPFINQLLQPLFKKAIFSEKENPYGFQKIKQKVVFNPFEAQLDTGNMMQELVKKAIQNDILILNQQTVLSHIEKNEGVEVVVSDFSFQTNKLFFATNGFASDLTNGEVKPARAQVLITKPIPNLAIQGTFHLDKGYYYFRNIDNRILLGGGRNLDFVGETTTELAQTELIQNQLEKLLREVILSNQKFEIDHRWSGIMGVGIQKNPIVKQLSEHVYCGVRLGGMGVAIGSLIGTELADLI